MKSLTKFFAAFSVLLIAHEAPAVTIVSSLNFEDGLIPKTNNWNFGAQAGGQMMISTNKSENHNGSNGSIKAIYPIATGGMYAWANLDISALNSRQVYLDFWAKMPKATQGLKFCKIFGVKGATTGYANTTFGLGAEIGRAGSLFQVSFGDGSEIDNDTGNVINLNGEYPDWIGRSYRKTATVSTPQNSIWSSTNWGTGWHHFRIHAKFNSGDGVSTEVGDGAYYLEIDNVVYVDAKGLLNRHPLNKPIGNISFFDWSQGGTSAFEVWFDDIIVTTDGFVNAPNPPQGVKLN